jgi:hypothetical protein
MNLFNGSTKNTDNRNLCYFAKEGLMQSLYEINQRISVTLVELTFQVFFVDPQIDRSSQAPKK